MVGIFLPVKIWAITVTSICMKNKIIGVVREVDLEASFKIRLHLRRVLLLEAKVQKIERAVASKQIEAIKMMPINSIRKMRKMDMISSVLLVVSRIKGLN
jgi:hypothetical protein